MAKRPSKQAAELAGFYAEFSRTVVPRATVSALNKAAPLARTRTVRAVSKITGIQQKLIRKRTYFRKANTRSLRASLRTYTQGVSLINMNPRDTGKGGWRTRRGQGVRARGGFHYRQAFIANGPNGKRQVFQRTGQKTGSYHHVDAVKVGIRDAVETVAPVAARRVMKQRFPGLMSHEIDRRLKKVGK